MVGWRVKCVFGFRPFDMGGCCWIGINILLLSFHELILFLVHPMSSYQLQLNAIVLCSWEPHTHGILVRTKYGDSSCCSSCHYHVKVKSTPRFVLGWEFENKCIYGYIHTTLNLIGISTYGLYSHLERRRRQSEIALTNVFYMIFWLITWKTKGKRAFATILYSRVKSKVVVLVKLCQILQHSALPYSTSFRNLLFSLWL